jgi:hypothetical protein
MSARARTTNHIRLCKTKTGLRRGKTLKNWKMSPRYIAATASTINLTMTHKLAASIRLSKVAADGS